MLDWVHRMLWPRAEGAFETWSTLAPTLMPILTRQVGAQFMPWTCANEKALAERRRKNSASRSRQGLDPEAAEISRALARMLRARYAEVTDKAALDPVLDAAGCLAGLRG